MTLDNQETLSGWSQTAYACTAERQGIWTLWWRHETLRASVDLFEQQNMKDLPIDSDASLILNDVEIAVDSLMSIRTKLKKNGLILFE